MGRITDLATGFPGYHARIAKRARLPPRDARAQRLRHVRGRQVAPHARRRAPPRGARATAGRSGAASSAGTASSVARPTSSRRRSSTTTTASPQPRPYDEGYHLSEDLADRAIEFLADLQAVEPEQAVLPLLLHRRVPLAAPRAARLDRALPRPLRRRLGRVARARPSPASRRWASCRRAPSSRPGRSGCRRGTRCRATSSGSPHASWSASPRSSRHADHQIGRVLDFLDRDRTSSTTRSCSCSPTTARRPKAGSTVRSTTPARGTSSAGPRTRRSPASTSSVGRPCTTTTRGAGPLPGNTPFRRWKREVHEGGVADPLIVSWPNGHHGTRRAPAPVRARHRPGADDPRGRRRSTRRR